MSTAFYWARRRPWLMLLLTAFVTFLVLAAWGATLHGGRRMDWLNLFLPWWIFLAFPGRMTERPLYVISHGVLAISPAPGLPARAVPLAVAEVRPEKAKWRLRWAEGRRRPEVKIPSDPDLTALVAAAIAERPEAGPATEKAAARLISFAAMPGRDDWKLWLMLAVLLIGYGLAIWQNQPLFLLPLVALPWLGWAGQVRRLVLTPEALWIVSSDSEPNRIDRGAVTAVTVQKAWAAIRTSHPDFPVIRISAILGADIERRLRYGDAGPAPKATAGTAPAPGAARCSLCGSPMDSTAHPGEVLICERCNTRARLEAGEGGHGLAGRDPKPM